VDPSAAKTSFFRAISQKKGTFPQRESPSKAFI